MARLNHTKKKPLVPIIIFIVGMVIFVLVKLYNQKNIASAEIETRLRSAAGSLEMIVTDSMIDNAQKRVPVDFIDHETVRSQANKIAKIHNVIYAYAMIKSGDSALFVFSSYIESDITGDIVTGYLDNYAEATDVMIRAFESDSPEVFDKSQDQWGVFQSIYLPHKTKSGTPYLLCADVKVSEVTDYQLRYLVEFSLSTVFLFLISLPLFLWMRKR